MKNRKLAVGLGIALAVLIAAAVIVWGAFGPSSDKGDISSSVSSSVSQSQTEITVKLVLSDGEEKTFELKTEKQTLGDALYENGLVSEEEYASGFYTVIDGVRADYNEDGAWWCVTKGGEMTTVGMNEQTIENGDSFEITYTPA
ncbi:MAG: DUF4430 domain-containing protein [Clostridia bacterium]|nr:DUF4430 domain-containing protein [Clostridia bacterium]